MGGPTPPVVPDRRDWFPALGAWLSSGVKALELAQSYTPDAGPVAVDIETPGLVDTFTIKCVTFAFQDTRGVYHAGVLDPQRRPDHQQGVQDLLERAPWLVAHNAPFDCPSLHAQGLLPLAGLNKVYDTLVDARLAWPDTLMSKSLDALAQRLLGAPPSGGMSAAFKAAGYTRQEDGWREMDIDTPVYRWGAMADTVVTLKIAPLCREAAVHRLLDHPFTSTGLTQRADADALVDKMQRVNRIMLRRSCRGMAVDLEHLARYQEQVHGDMERAKAALTAAGCRPGVGLDMVVALEQLGALPARWPRTPTGKLSAAKDHVAQLDHPLAQHHHHLAHAQKVLGWLDKVVTKSEHTGRLHPQVAVLGASATGRMSYSEPELQQFSGEARPILVDETGLSSIDWAQIEPVTLANMAKDTVFLEPFEAGGDLYEPIQRAAGLPLDKDGRKVAKVVLLATMYGQGTTRLASTIKSSVEGARQIQAQMRAAMPQSSRFMHTVKTVAEQHGLTLTAAGRILTIPQHRGIYLAHKSTNYLTQGSAADVLYDAIIRVEDAGLGDHIFLALHDELVVQTPAAEGVRAIMTTPPDFLTHWAGRTPVLRTDCEHLGRAWQSC